MTSHRQLGLFPERGDGPGPGLYGPQTVTGRGLQIRNRVRDEVGELVGLELAPDVLGRVQFGGIGRKELELNHALQRFDVVARQPTFSGTQADENAYIERFNRTYREEVLRAYLFDSLDEVRDITADWLERYNEVRPHEALGSLPPARYRERLLAAQTPV